MDPDITKMWQWDQNYSAGTLIPGIFNDAFINFIVVRSTEHHIVGWLQTSGRCGRKRQKPNLKQRSEFPCRDSGKNHKKPWGNSHPQSWDLNQDIPVYQPRRSVKRLQQVTKNPTVGQISNLGPPKYGAGVLFTRQVRSVCCIDHYGG